MLNEILSRRLQTYIKNIVHHDQVRLIPAMPGWFSINGLEKNYMIISTDSEKNFDKF